MGKRKLLGETWYVCDNCGAGIPPDRVIIVREGKTRFGMDESHFCTVDCLVEFAERGCLLPGTAVKIRKRRLYEIVPSYPWKRLDIEDDEDEEDEEVDPWRIL